MPYYLHKRDESPTNGTEYATKQSAINDRIDDMVITFVASVDESENWRYRERDRSYTSYTQVPWRSAIWYDQYSNLHFAHLSIEHPDQIAYTPTEEHGHSDRQLRVRPGKYLKQFAPHLNQSQVDEYIAECKTSTTLHFAESADDIETVYMHGSIKSCMDRHHRNDGSFDHEVPVRAYGDSDLSVAYLGAIDNASARSVVWQAKQIYTRVYGDRALESALRQAGYAHGSLAGARIKKIARGDGFLMPYIDGCGSATELPNWLKLTDDGEYSTQVTNGCTAEQERYTCSHCGDQIDDDDTYCQSCEDNRWTCDDCGGESFDSDDVNATDDGTYCESCYRDLQTECAIDDCENRWIETEDFSRSEQRDRADECVNTLCAACAKVHRYCCDCDSFVPDDDPCDCTRANDDDTIELDFDNAATTESAS